VAAAGVHHQDRPPVAPISATQQPLHRIRAGLSGVLGQSQQFLRSTSDKSMLAWVAFVLLLPVAVLGFTMLAWWIPARRTGTAESRFPVPVVVGHGLFAATTLVLVLLAALG
jgi:hypothetical protein